jgi:hypothetical protein
VGRQSGAQGSAQEAFLLQLNREVQKVAAFTDHTSGLLLAAVQELNAKLARLPPGSADLGRHSQQAKHIGDELLQLEKYVNINDQVGGRTRRPGRRPSL